MEATKFNIYEMISNKILEAIERTGKLVWVKEWKMNKGNVPMNGATKRPYSGVNFFLLSLSGYSSNFWLTYKQATELGGTIKKGEKATQVIFWKLNKITETKNNVETEKNIPLLRYYSVFNLEQTENVNLNLPVIIKEDYNENSAIEVCESIISDYIKKESIIVSINETDQPFYRPVTDSINLPMLKQFSNSNAFYSVYFHELAHSTGHKKRLNRKGVTEPIGFGSDKYGEEELIAELSSAFLCAEIGISNDTIERNNEAYIKNWFRVIKADKKMFLSCSQKAAKSTNFILNKVLDIPKE